MTTRTSDGTLKIVVNAGVNLVSGGGKGKEDGEGKKKGEQKTLARAHLALGMRYIYHKHVVSDPLSILLKG